MEPIRRDFAVQDHPSRVTQLEKTPTLEENSPQKGSSQQSSAQKAPPPSRKRKADDSLSPTRLPNLPPSFQQTATIPTIPTPQPAPIPPWNEPLQLDFAVKERFDVTLHPLHPPTQAKPPPQTSTPQARYPPIHPQPQQQMHQFHPLPSTNPVPFPAPPRTILTLSPTCSRCNINLAALESAIYRRFLPACPQCHQPRRALSQQQMAAMPATAGRASVVEYQIIPGENPVLIRRPIEQQMAANMLDQRLVGGAASAPGAMGGRGRGA